MKKKGILALSLCAALLLGTVQIPLAAAADAAPDAQLPASKDEVVYARLTADGAPNGIYVVNVLDVTAPGAVLDYGDYDSVQNLTDLSALSTRGGGVTMEAPAGKFYYQGNLPGGTLPWDFHVTYRLDGAELDAAALGGKSGHLEMQIESASNSDANQAYFEHYLLQISLTLPGDSCKNLDAPEATVVSAGQDYMVNFNSLPGKNGNFSLACDVTDFSFGGISISAVPFAMSFELPDLGQLTGGLGTLAEAVNTLHGGVSELNTGAAALRDGAAKLTSGSAAYQSGLNQLAGQSAQLTRGSKDILDGLNALSAALSGRSATGGMDLSALGQLPDNLKQLSQGLYQACTGLETLRSGYSQALSTLETAIDAIPDYHISQAEIQALLVKTGNDPTAAKLVETYAAAVQVKETYAQLRESLHAMDTSLTQMKDSITKISDTIAGTAAMIKKAMTQNGLDGAMTQLQGGIAKLAGGYQSFHAGLSQYTGGVSKLSSSYTEIQKGLTSLSGGASQLKNGTGELDAGTKTLADETAALPDKMETEIQKLADGYGGSKFEPVSFTSAKNTNIGSVSFVLKLDGVEKPAAAEETAPPKAPETFWSRLKALFT